MDVMMTAPTEVDLQPMSVDADPEASEQPRLTRSSAGYEETSGRFRMKAGERNFSLQYSHVYNKRLLQMRRAASDAAKRRWGEGAHAYVDKIIDLPEQTEVVVVGTLYKDMKLKPSTLDQYKELAQISAPVAPLDDFTEEGDNLILEDESGRVVLSWSEGALAAQLNSHTVTTGVVLAIKGTVSGGCFSIAELCFPGLAPQPEVRPWRLPRWCTLPALSIFPLSLCFICPPPSRSSLSLRHSPCRSPALPHPSLAHAHIRRSGSPYGIRNPPTVVADHDGAE